MLRRQRLETKRLRLFWKICNNELQSWEVKSIVQIDYPTLQFSIGYLQKWSPALAFGTYQLLVMCMAPSIINVELCNKFSGHSDPASALVVSLYLERLVESKETCYWFS